ncbi:unnamed protein product [Rotaria sp. Silwood2]|nr:unnamed protein product [Rotaria sp. Silwood2]CAF3027844.1 unnamed protein product [Rotaria sp. Silwood2]CAF4562967.1 unnamed protein product [Rotaria sp. Silwood2]
MIVRRETFDKATLETMKTFMGYVLEYLGTIANFHDENKLATNAAKATQQLMDRSLYREYCEWKPTTEKHEDFDVTFILPLNTAKQQAILISMSQQRLEQ